MGQVIVLELENCLLVSFGYDDVTVTSLKFTLRDDLGYHCSKWSLDTRYSQIQESKLEMLASDFGSWHVMFPNSTIGTHNWMAALVPPHPWSGDHRRPPEQAIDLWKAHGRGSSLRFCLETKDANHISSTVNTTWPSGSQEEIKISDALSGGCQIEQLKGIIALTQGIIGGLLNKQLICGKRHGRGSSFRFCLKIKDANQVNTTWPSGSQEEIKISDALSGGCQIEQLKGIIALTQGIIGGLLNKQLICGKRMEEEAACGFVWR